jgi:hypothetical protein
MKEDLPSPLAVVRRTHVFKLPLTMREVEGKVGRISKVISLYVRKRFVSLETDRHHAHNEELEEERKMVSRSLLL